MSIFQWAGLAVALTTLFGSLVATIRFLVKHYLSELRPNSGSSIKDQVSRLENRVDEIYSILISKEKK